MITSLATLLPIIKNQYPQAGIALDVGAHHGEFSNFLLKTQMFGKVIAFEPNPASYEKLITAVSPSENCQFQAVNLGLGADSAQVDLYYDNDTSCASVLPYAEGYRSSGEVKKQGISVIALDEYLAVNLPGSPVNCMKIDTQGNDLEVLRGARNTLERYRPVIQLEFIYMRQYEMQCSPDELTKLLTGMGYLLHSLCSIHVTKEGSLAYCDAVFIPNELVIPFTQEYTCIDNLISYQTQIQILTQICHERGALIDRLDHEIKSLQAGKSVLMSKVLSYLRRFK